MMRRGQAVRSALLPLFLLVWVLLQGCVSLPLDYPRPVSTALSLPEETRMGRKVQARAERHHGESGFYLLSSGDDAFVARLLAVDLAEKTIDLQYYIFQDDFTGKLMLDRLVAAAERGVRVRLLLDDWEPTGKMDWGLAMIQISPNIEVRVFNPFGGLRSNPLSRPLQAIFGPNRLKGRMHNKAFIVDNSLAIVGGRNIADEYFGLRAAINFGDLDIMAIGPVTRRISAVFDDYWNCVLAIPLNALTKRQPTAADREVVNRFFKSNQESVKNSGYAKRLKESSLAKQVQAGHVPFIWARAEVLYDDPLKVIWQDNHGDAASMGQRLKTLIDAAQHEVLLISPYLVPGQGVQWFKQLRDRGVTVKILTNSLASTDSPLAEGGYARYRRPLLGIGVQLYELKPNPDQYRFWDKNTLGSSSKGSLHAKTVIIDDEVVVVGSFNLDPRSAILDTQNGLAIWSPELRAQAAKLFAEGIAPDNAYQVKLEGDIPLSEEWHGLVWVTEENHREVRYYVDPMTTFGCRLEMRLLSRFVPELQL